MFIKFWGTGGSIATPGPDTVKFGGNTACVEVVSNTGQRLVIDAGTGIRPWAMNWSGPASRCT